RIAQRAELDGYLQRIAVAAGKRLADQHLVVAHAVEIAGVEQRDAGVQRRMDGRDALGAVCGAVEIRHAHAAEPECRDGGADFAEFASVHVSSPRNGAPENEGLDAADMSLLDCADKLDSFE